VTKRQAVFVGGLFGLVVPMTVLTLLYFYGVWDIMSIGHSDLRTIFWPFSVMLTTGWCRTVPGLLITVAAVAYNCLTYIGMALLLRVCVNLIAHRGRE
jgi:hypothetical protein